MNKTVSLCLVLSYTMLLTPALGQEASSAPLAPETSASMPADTSSSAAPAETPVADQAMIDAWQGSITSQIQAFRTHDAPGALKLASAEFHKSFTDPELFYKAIIGSGYQPIVDSRSESFGDHKLIAPDMALQDVKLLGTDQSVYEAIYQMVKEPEGWRVAGVQLLKTPAIGV